MSGSALHVFRHGMASVIPTWEDRLHSINSSWLVYDSPARGVCTKPDHHGNGHAKWWLANKPRPHTRNSHQSRLWGGVESQLAAALQRHVTIMQHAKPNADASMTTSPNASMTTSPLNLLSHVGQKMQKWLLYSAACQHLTIETRVPLIVTLLRLC